MKTYFFGIEKEMSRFVIPTRAVITACVPTTKIPYEEVLQYSGSFDLEEHDKDLLKGVDNNVRDIIENNFNTINTQTLCKINELIENNSKQKQTSAIDVNETYTKLMTELEKCFATGSKSFKAEIVGQYTDSWTTRSVESWNECNPNKKVAIDRFISELRAKLWNPNIQGISDCGYDSDDGMHCGGDVLTIICDLN